MANREIHQPRKAAPRFFYGYIVVGVAFLIMLVSWGTYNTFGVFFRPLQAEFGWSSAVTSSVFSLSMLIYGVLGMAAGGLNDRFGPRVLLTCCGVLLGIGYLLMSQVNALWQIYLFLGIVAGIGISGIWVPQLSSVARWFVKRRSLMTGIVIAGVGIGQLIGPPVISRLIANYDWRLSYIILGGTVLVIMVLAAQFLKRDPVQMGQLPYGENEGKQQVIETETEAFSLKEAVSTVQFWISFLVFFILGFSTFGIMVHIVPHAIELEIPAITAANILAAIGGISIVGNYVLGGLADRIGNKQIVIIGCIMTAAAFFWLMLARELWMLYLFAAILGLAIGGTSAVESPLVAWLFGLRSHGLIYGFIHLGFTVGAAAGPFVTGYIFDLTGSYQVAFLVSAVISVVGIVMTAILRPTKKVVLDGV